MVFYSKLKGKSVVDCNEHPIGKIKDFIFVDGPEYAKISHLIFINNYNETKKIEWKYIKEIKEKRTKKKNIEICLNCSKKNLKYLPKKQNDPLVSFLLDKQIVDVDGQKIVRVNDVLMAKVKNKFSVVAVCVGTRSLMRVLGVSGVKKVLGEEKIISWSSVESLDEEMHDLHLKYQKSKIADLHPSDIADIIEDLSHDKRELIFDSLGKRKAAKTLAEVEPEVQTSFLKNLKIVRIVEILQNMPASEAADILSLMPERRARSILASMKGENSKEIREILKYPEESAGSIMHTEFISLPKTYTAEQTIDHLRKIKPPSEELYHLYVVDNKGKLMGVLPIRTLLTAGPKIKIEKLMHMKIAKVRLETPKKDVAHAITKYNLFAIPAVDRKNVLKGVVKVDEVLEEVMPKSWKKSNFKRAHHKQE